MLSDMLYDMMWYDVDYSLDDSNNNNNNNSDHPTTSVHSLPPVTAYTSNTTANTNSPVNSSHGTGYISTRQTSNEYDPTPASPTSPTTALHQTIRNSEEHLLV